MKYKQHTYPLQIQPQFGSRDEWQAFALEHDLYYEPLEFFLGAAIHDPECFALYKQWYAESGRVRSLHGAFIDLNPASGDPAFKQLSRQRSHESCALARDLGASHVVLHGSCFPFLRGPFLDNHVAQCADFYAEIAGEYGLTICIENALDLDPTPLRALMERSSGANVGVCLDIGHASYSRAPLEKWFDELHDHICYLHLSDNTGLFDDHLPLGDGCIDWALADRLWRQLGREMPITLEVGGLDGVKKSMAYMREHGYFGLEAGCNDH